MTGKRDLSTAREWGREILKTHELQEYNSAPENALIPVIDVTQIQADAQPRKMTISGVVNSAIEAGIIDPAGGGGGGLAAVVDDTTPQLGGDLDVNGQSIVSTSNQNVKVAPDGTGVTEFMGSAGNDAAIQLNCEVNTHGVKIKSPPHSAAASYTLTLPDTTGTSGQLMTTDGSGKLSFTTAGLPTATTDGKALIVQNGQWVEGPVIGGVDYNTGATGGTDYTVPTGFSVWQSTFSVQPTNQATNVTLSNSDFTATATATSTKDFTSQTTKNSGKLYWEIKVLNLAGATANVGLTTDSSAGPPGGGGTGGFGWRSQGGNNNNSGGSAASVWGTSWGADDVLMFAIDFGAKKFWAGKNGTWLGGGGGGDPAAGTGAGLSNWTGTPDFYFAISAGTNGQSAEIRSTYNAGIVVIPAADSFRTILGIGEYADDTAAGTGGVATGSLFYNTTASGYVLKS